MNQFLALTSLEKFWDKNAIIYYLGPWCIPFNKENIDRNFLLPDPWSKKESLLNARLEVDHLYQQYLFSLSKILNEIHAKNERPDYWEILIGSWLRIYITVIYDRWHCLKQAFDLHPMISTIALDKDAYIIPNSCEDFTNYLSTDIYNLQIFSDILRFLNIHFTSKSCDIKNELSTFSIGDKNKKWKKFIRNLTNNIFGMFGKKESVYIYESGLPFLTLCWLFLKSKGHIVPLTSLPNPKFEEDINYDKRKRFRTLQFDYTYKNTDLVNCITELLPRYLPATFIENYDAYRKIVAKLGKPKVIFSAMGWHYKETFKYFAATQKSSGSLLCGHQHGGDYGMLSYHASEIHERKITDKFYTWGWQESEKNIIPFNSLKLRQIIKYKKKKNSDADVLYGTTNGYRYLFRLNYSLTALLNYYQQQKIFIEALPKYIRSNLQIRLHRHDWGWQRTYYWQRFSRDIIFQSQAIPFLDALTKCRIYISDHISTTFTESLCMNKPTLIICDQNMWPIRESAKQYFQLLNEAQLIYGDALAAASTLKLIYPQIEEWWMDCNRQKAINEFRSQFCQPASLSLKEWLNEFVILNKINLQLSRGKL